jgi:hypothetical protein
MTARPATIAQYAAAALAAGMAVLVAVLPMPAAVPSAGAPAAAAGPVRIVLPLGRAAYQTNEMIDVAVVRTGAAALAKGGLVLTLTAEDGSKTTCTFAAPAAAAGADGKAQSTEHLHLNGWLLRPGRYVIDVACDGAAAKAEIDAFSHVRKSSFRVVDWGSRAAGPLMEVLREDGMGFNTVLGEFRVGKMANVEACIRGGLDFMQVCTMSGAHQMDLRTECDWSDPYVLGGGVARGVQQAFISRTAPNCLGVHFYDEPGLTWGGRIMSPFTVPSQERSYKAAFAAEPFPVEKVDPKDPAARAAWSQWQKWHESFMDAAWKHSAFGVRCVRDDFLPITQSVYGFTAYADGYYFNVVRSLPLISGHGGYSDGVGGFFYTLLHMEYGRARDMNKPYWYLPSWYKMDSDQYRIEQYLSFACGIQGMMKPPDHEIHKPATCQDADGIVEANKIQARLGTIFNEMPTTRPPVAVLYSMSQLLDAEMTGIAEANAAGGEKRDYNRASYEGGGHTRGASSMNLIASKMIQVPMLPVVDEDILDGTVARNHKVLVLPAVDSLEAPVLAAVEAYIQGGGVVLVSDDSKVQIKGVTKVGVPLDRDYYFKGGQQWKAQDGTYWKLQSPAAYQKMVAPYAKALAARLKSAGIEPVFECDNPAIVPGRQGQGDIEYLFAVNSASDPAVGMCATIPAEATIGLADDGRPVYDAICGGVAAEFAKAGGKLTAKLRFGGGGMRAFARTRSAIGAVQATTPVQQADFTLKDNPIRVEIGAVLMGADGRILAGPAPLAVQVIDPLGTVRYDLLRATNRGVFRMVLPLAANDPAGQWKVVVRELLSGKEDTTTFQFAAAASCGALATATPRAVYFGNDRENIFRFFKLHKDVTIVVGTGAYDQAAAERLTGVLAPWGVRCKTMLAAEAAKPHAVPAEAQKTWCGLDAGRPDPARPAVSQVGFNVDGPAILLGTPQDNPLIAFAAAKGFLPYAASPDFPGRGRGYIAWQADATGYFNQESIALIAYDEAGMAEAVGSVYECAAGIDPLMAMAPATVVVQAVKQAPPPPATLKVAWSVALNDRVLGMKAEGGKCTVVTNDGSVAEIADGKLASSKVVGVKEAIELAKAMKGEPAKAPPVKAPGLIVKHVLAMEGGTVAVAFWGGMLMVTDAEGNVKAQRMLPNDIGALAQAGGRLIVGLADGQAVALDLK